MNASMPRRLNNEYLDELVKLVEKVNQNNYFDKGRSPCSSDEEAFAPWQRA